MRELATQPLSLLSGTEIDTPIYSENLYYKKNTKQADSFHSFVNFAVPFLLPVSPILEKRDPCDWKM